MDHGEQMIYESSTSFFELQYTEYVILYKSKYLHVTSCSLTVEENAVIIDTVKGTK